MYYAQPVRVQPRGLPTRKDIKLDHPDHYVRRDLPEGHHPTARIERVRAASRPNWRSNRQGWSKFYRWQSANNHLLWLMNRIERRAEPFRRKQEAP